MPDVAAPETALVRDLRRFVTELARIYGQDLVAAILYGQAVELERPPRDGEVQVLVVLTAAALPALARSQDAMAAWWKSHRLAPLLIGRDEFYRSLDVFPLEFLDMKRRYVLLHGEDVLARMEIRPEHIRLQVEEGLKTKAIWLRQLFVREGGRERPLREILAESYRGLADIFDGLLALRGQPLPASQLGMIDAVAAAYRQDPGPLRELRALAAGEVRPDHQGLVRLAYAYDQALQALIEAVDRMEAA